MGKVSAHLPFSASSLSGKNWICINCGINLHKLLHKRGNFKCRGQASGAAVKDVRAQIWSKWPREKGGVWEREREVVHSRSQSPGFYNKLSSLWRSSCRRGCNVWSQIMADTDKSFRSTRLWISVKATTTVPRTDTGTCASCQLENGSIFVPSRWALKELLKTEAVFFFFTMCPILCLLLRGPALDWTLQVASEVLQSACFQATNPSTLFLTKRKKGGQGLSCT